ncbi:twin-arginine translocation signal domain-containing protein, partial [bacterium]
MRCRFCTAHATAIPSSSSEPMKIPRRDFLRLTGAAAAGVALTPLPIREAKTRFVPAEKGGGPEALARLTARTGRETYRGEELRYIGMPIGGICAGTLYLSGDGRLWLWDVFNEIKEGTVPQRATYRGATLTPNGGANYIHPPEPVSPLEQGFALRVDGRVRRFDATGWRDVGFTGEYPIGFVTYRDPESTIEVDLEAFSPFIPLDEDASGLPATVMSYT